MTMESPTISGTTRLIGLIGSPVAHSLSPQIHNHAFKTLGLPYAYVPLNVPSGQLHTAMMALRSLSFIGANVTVPYKKKVVPYCDVLSPLSTIIGAVNTLYFGGGLLHGHTTDVEGFFRALSWMGFDPRGGNIVILGNGGIARTLSFAFAMDYAVNNLTLIGRDRERVSALSREVSEKTDKMVMHAVFQSGDYARAVKECSLLINCTSIGMHPYGDVSPIDGRLLHEAITVFDTVYNPGTTKLLSLAKSAGCRTQNGLRMLLYQGLASFKLWTGIEVDEKIFSVEELQSLVDRGV
jgi:shikimate dehydrogenase